MEGNKSPSSTTQANPSQQHGTQTLEAANAAVFENLDIDTCTEKDLDERVKKAVKMVNTNQVEEAIVILEETLQIAENKFKSNTFLIANYHFELGNALLTKIENSRDVFGDAIKISEQETQAQAEAEKKGNDKPAPEEATNQTGEGTTATSKDLVTIADETNGPRDSDEEPEEADQPEPEKPEEHKEVEGTQEITTNKENPDEKEEADVDDLQVGWEHLEVARLELEKLMTSTDPFDPNLTLKQIEENTKIIRKLSDVMIRLGDANCSSDKFDEALQDYEKCLKLRNFTEDKFTSRDLAEIYYLMGNAKSYKNSLQFDEEALVEYNKARLILENLLFKMMGNTTFKDPEDPKNFEIVMSSEFLKPNMFENTKQKEVKEILIDLYNKIEDTKSQISERAKVDQEFQKAKKAAEDAAAENTFAKPVLSATTNPNEKPKIVHLGTLGNAKKRTRDQMENQGAAPNGLPNGEKKVTFATNPLFTSPLKPETNQKPGDLRSGLFDDVIKKADEDGHIEKMVKKTSE